MTLYRQYRPQTIEELDLASVREELRKLAASLDKIPHAFLFAGPRGSGKTSAARILAKLINCVSPVVTKNGIEPCNKCEQCKSITNGQSMDIVELDTASNRGIDDIRALRENIMLSPASAKKKVYIMDEAHMLTPEAANAFLKTLEEPPSHAVFILATTDPHKLPETVLSRLTNIPFRKASNTEIARQIGRVAKGESIEIDDEAVELIAKKADGSFRDAVKTLESLALNHEKITKAKVEDLVFSSNVVNIENLLKLIVAKNLDEALKEVRKYSEAGGEIKELVEQLEELLHSELLLLAKKEKSTLELPLDGVIKLIKLLMEARGSLVKTAIPELPLEIAIIEWSANAPDGERKTESSDPPKKAETAPEKKVEVATVLAVPAAVASPTPPAEGQIDAEVWSKILLGTRIKNASLEALLRTARPIGLTGNTLNLAVYYQFHKERLEVSTYRKLVEGVLEEVTGIAQARLVCILEEPPPELLARAQAKASLTPSGDRDILEAAKDIFGN